jgi:hypothetical protein
MPKIMAATNFFNFPDRPFKSYDTSTLCLVEINSGSHLASAGIKLLLRRTTETIITDFFAHFLAPPSHYKKLGMFLAGSPQIKIKNARAQWTIFRICQHS